MDNGNPSSSKWASTSTAISALPSFSSLQTWVFRPQAVAKCSISDIYALRALVVGTTEIQFGSREVFLLNNYPCRLVELVGWVAGVEDKESTQVITYDGDGQHVIPITVHLPLVKPPIAKSPAKPKPPHSAPLVFVSKEARRARREAEAAEEGAKATTEEAAKTKAYARKDIRVGDVVRLVGRVDEYCRRKVMGDEWVRNVTVDEGSGGMIDVVDPDQQYLHCAKVEELHQSLYCRAFELPSTMLMPSLDLDQNGSFELNIPSAQSTYSDGMTLGSEMPSEVTLDGTSALPDIRRLRSSQLTENTFQRYLLDHMMEESRSSTQAAELYGPAHLRSALNQLFPELPSASAVSNTYSSPYSCPSSYLQQSPGSYVDDPSTSGAPSWLPSASIPAFTVQALLEVPELSELAGLIVDAQAKKEERERRRRINDGLTRERDRLIDEDRRKRGLRKGEWKLGKEEKRRSVQALFRWGLRSLAAEGSVVQVDWTPPLPSLTPNVSRAPIRPHHHANSSIDINLTPRKSYSLGDQSLSRNEVGYIALPPPLLLPLIIHRLKEERIARRAMFMSSSDPRRVNGATIEEILRRMRRWGMEGRWERLGEWRIEEAVSYGLAKGLLFREGRGYWSAE